MPFIYIWEYTVKKEFLQEFIKAYRPEGDWVQLFKKSKGYIKTDLLQDHSNPTRFVTIDYWNSKQDRDAFQDQFAGEFKQLDQACEKFTQNEKWLGDFDVSTD